MGWLGSSTDIFWNNKSILLVYKLQCSMKLCSKDFSQQPIESMVALSKTNASVVEFVGSV